MVYMNQQFYNCNSFIARNLLYIVHGEITELYPFLPYLILYSPEPGMATFKQIYICCNHYFRSV